MAYEISRQLTKSCVLALRPAEFQRDILPFLVTGFRETFAECGYLLRSRSGRAGIEKSDHRHRRLLRARSERPRSHRAAEQRDELAALHSITSSARATSMEGSSRPSFFAVFRFAIS